MSNLVMHFTIEDEKKVLLRPAETKDAAAIVDTTSKVTAEEIYLAAEKARWTVSDLAEVIQYMTSYPYIMVVEVDKQIIGHAFVQRGQLKKNCHAAGIGMLLVQGYRNKGIGTKMMEYIEAWSRNLGLKKLFLSVFHTNKRAIQLYKKSGFVVEGIREGQFLIHGEYVSEVVMGKPLTLDLKEKFKKKAYRKEEENV